MSGTGNALATRPNGAAPVQHTSSAVAIRGNQSEFDDKQKAALVAMGVSEKATRAELAVFFHQCRNTQLDPFLKQIYLIHRRSKEGDKWVDKPTTQVGIDGFRVIRDRIADKKGLRVEYEDTIWYDGERNAYDVWIDDVPPAACKVVVLVDGRRFPSVLRFNEYCQFGREDDNGNKPRTGRWRDGFAHQIEKCCEADALRKAFPNDMAGLVLEDAAPLSDPDAPDRLPSDRARVTAEQARQRVTSTVETVTPEPSPAAPEPPVSGPAAITTPTAEVAAAGEATHLKTGPEYIAERLEKLGVTGIVHTAGRLAGRQLTELDDLTDAEAVMVMRTLSTCKTPNDLDGVLADLAMADDPRGGDGQEGGGNG